MSSKLQGGNVVRGSGVISCPEGCTAAQWNVLSNSHNHTQLFAIKYVLDR